MNRPFIALLGAALAAQGCAFSLSGPDPARPRGTLPSCDRSKGLVFADGLGATASLVGAAALASDNESGAAVAFLALGLVYTVAAIKGNAAVNDCFDATTAFEGELADLRAREATAAGPRDVAEPPARPTPVEEPPPPPPVVVTPPPPKPVPKPPGDDRWSEFWREP